MADETLSFFLGFILMLAMVTIAVLIYFNMVNTREIEKNFDDFVEKLNELKEGERDYTLFYGVGKSYAILGFTKDTSKIRKVEVANPGNKLKGKGIDPVNDLYSAEEYFINSLDTGEELAREGTHFERPSNCEDNKACVCLCSKLAYVSRDKKYVCKGKIKCESLGGSKDFLKHINVYKLGYSDKNTPMEFLKWINSGKWNIIDGGFVIGRLEKFGLTIPSSFNQDIYPRNEIYFERKGNIIGVCLDAPCIFEKSSGEVTKTTLEEEKETSKSGSEDSKEGLLE